MFIELLQKLSRRWFGQYPQALFSGKGYIVTREQLAERDEMIARTICKRLARGNISLQMGKYITSAELDARRERNLQYSFTD